MDRVTFLSLISYLLLSLIAAFLIYWVNSWVPNFILAYIFYATIVGGLFFGWVFVDNKIRKKAQTRPSLVTQQQLAEDRTRIIDVCVAHVVLLAARFRALEEELRRQESLASMEKVDIKASEHVKSDFFELMKYYDEIRETAFVLAATYRQQNPSVQWPYKSLE